MKHCLEESRGLALLAGMNLGELEYGVSAEEQLLEVLGDKNKEEENAEELQARLVMECLGT